VVITVIESGNIALTTLCDENGSILLPQIRTENCAYHWRDLPRVCACVCVCVRVCVYMGVTWRSKGGANGPPIFSLPKNILFLATELKMANKNILKYS
jgi:hypothetical protein